MSLHKLVCVASGLESACTLELQGSSGRPFAKVYQSIKLSVGCAQKKVQHRM